jgi:hypothetical protein
MTYFAPLLAGLGAGMVVASLVLHWLAGLTQVIGSRSGKPRRQVFLEALIVTIANSGFWILIVCAFVAYQVFSAPFDRSWFVGLFGFLTAILLLSALAFAFGRDGSGSLLKRFALAMRRKSNFLRFGMGTTVLVSAPMLWEWHEQGASGGFLLFVALVWAGGFYLALLYIWQFVPWDKPGLVRQKPDGLNR